MLALCSYRVSNSSSVCWGCAQNLCSEQRAGTGPADNVITGLEFLVDLPMWSLVGQQDWEKMCVSIVLFHGKKHSRRSIIHRVLSIYASSRQADGSDKKLSIAMTKITGTNYQRQLKSHVLIIAWKKSYRSRKNMLWNSSAVIRSCVWNRARICDG